MKLVFNYVFCFVICIWCSLVCYSEEMLKYSAKKIKKTPIVDGDLSDECWMNAQQAGNFYLHNKLKQAMVQTQAWAVYDDKNLYIAFKCFEPRMNEIKAPKRLDDGRVADDDCVELFVSAGTNGKTYYHYLVNPANARQDQWNQTSPRVADNKWDAKWQSATKKRERLLDCRNGGSMV